MARASIQDVEAEHAKEARSNRPVHGAYEPGQESFAGRLGACEVSVVYEPARAPTLSWLTLFEAFAAPERDYLETWPSSATEARDLICGEGCDKAGLHPIRLVVNMGYGSDLVMGGFVRVGTRGELELFDEHIVAFREYHCQPELEADTHLGSARLVLAPPLVVGASERGECVPEVDDDCMIGCFNAYLEQVQILQVGDALALVRMRRPSDNDYIYATDWRGELMWSGQFDEAPTACVDSEPRP